jgi:hypothetical protein
LVKMPIRYKPRSISSKENYATYLALPLLRLERHNFDGFINSFVTYNGKIAVLVETPPREEIINHDSYLTDFGYKDGILILFSCPEAFVDDIGKLIDGKYSQLSDGAKEHIYAYSSLVVDFPNTQGILVSSRLVQVLRQDKHLREFINSSLGIELAPGAELEERLRPQDILEDVDIDLTFK